MITGTTQSPRRNPIQLTLASLATALLLVACGGGGGGGTTTNTPSGTIGPLVKITGVAIGADGQPLASNATATSSFLSRITAAGDPVTVTLKDSNGTLASATVNSQGEYTIEKAGLTPPYLLKVQRGNETPLYAVSSVDKPATINISPLTSRVVEVLLEEEDKSAKTVLTEAYASNEKIAIPTPETIAGVKKYVKKLLVGELKKMGASAEAIAKAVDGLNETASTSVATAAVQAAPKVTETNDGTVVETLTIGEETCTRRTVTKGTQKTSTLECKKGTAVTVNSTDVTTIVSLDDLTSIRTMLDGLAVALTGKCSDLMSVAGREKLLGSIHPDFINSGENGPTNSASWAQKWCENNTDNQITTTFDLDKIARTEGDATYLAATVNQTKKTKDGSSKTDSFSFGTMSIAKDGVNWKLYGDRKIFSFYITNEVEHRYTYKDADEPNDDGLARRVHLQVNGEGFMITPPSITLPSPNPPIYSYTSSDGSEKKYVGYDYSSLTLAQAQTLAGKKFTVKKLDKEFTVVIPPAAVDSTGKLISVKEQSNTDANVKWQDLNSLKGKTVVATFEPPRFAIDYARIYISCQDNDKGTDVNLNRTATSAVMVIPECSEGTPQINISFNSVDGERITLQYTGSYVYPTGGSTSGSTKY